MNGGVPRRAATAGVAVALLCGLCLTARASTPGTTPTTSPLAGTPDTILPNGDVLLAGQATGAVPADVQAVIDSVRRTPSSNTRHLLDLLKPLLDLGMTPQEAAHVGMGAFPVGGQCVYSDDFLVPRFNGGKLHLHQGNDLFAPLGTPVRAPADGILRQAHDSLGGNVDYVTTRDGTWFYLAHLSAWVPGQSSNVPVKAGDIIGFVGNSGDAAGGATHVHFEIHPRGGNAIDPKPWLDYWLAQAVADVPTVLASYRSGLSRALVDVGLTRQLDGTPFSAPSASSSAQLLWESGASPVWATLAMAVADAREAVAAAGG